MEDERKSTQQYGHHQSGEATAAADEVEVKERGLIDTLLGRNKKPEEELQKKHEDELLAGMAHVTIPADAQPEKKKVEVVQYEHEAAAGGTGEKRETLFDKLQRTGSSSSSSSDEEEEEEIVDDNGEVVRRRKKKGLKDPKPYDGEHKAPYGPPVPVAPAHAHDHRQEEAEHKPYAVPAPAPVAPTHAYDHHKEEAEHKPYAVPAPTPVATHAYDHHKEEAEHKPYTVPAPAAPVPAYEELDDDHKAYIPAPEPAHVHDNGGSVVVQMVEGEEKKGILEKIKEKLPGGGHKKPEDAAAPATHAAPPAPHYAGEDQEKKQGLLGKIMDKIPGYNKGPAEEDHKAAAAAAGEHKSSS